MAQSLPIILVPGLLCSARLYRDQVPLLWQFGPVTIADHRRDDGMAAIAQRILAQAPPRFALAGLSMGGYIAFAMMRLAPERIARLALLDTRATTDAPARTADRHRMIALAQAGKLMDVVDLLTPRFIHRERQHDEELKSVIRAMARETGADAFVRQQQAIMSRPDSRPLLGSIRCPTLVVVGDADELTTPEMAREMATGILGARLVTVPRCGHLSTLERPDAVNAALADWLKH